MSYFPLNAVIESMFGCNARGFPRHTNLPSHLCRSYGHSLSSQVFVDALSSDYDPHLLGKKVGCATIPAHEFVEGTFAL